MKSFSIFFVALMFATLLPAATLFQKDEEFRIPIQSAHEMRFHLEKLPVQGEKILLEFDARLNYPGFGGYHAKAMLPYVNRTLIPVDSYLNCPMEFRFVNGHTGEPGRWNPPKINFNAIKSGNWHEDLVLKKGGNFFSLVYADNFDEIDTPKNPYSSPECSRCHFVFDITPLCRQGENLLELYNAARPADVKAMGGSMTDKNNRKGQLPMVVRHLVIHSEAEAPERQKPFWIKELAEISQTMPVIEPRKDFSEKYTLRSGHGGAVIIRIGSKEYRIASSYSYPGKGQFNRLPAGKGDEAGWSPTINVKELTADARGEYYSLHREVERHPGYFEIRDTLENLTDTPVPVRIRHEIPFKVVPGKSCIYSSGLKVTAPTSTQMYFPENPTLFLQTAEGSLGMTPVDDVLRIQSRNHITPEAVQLRDDQLMLAPRRKLTLRLQVFPIGAGGDYCTFINQVRHAWDLNGEEINGSFRSIISMPKPSWKLNKGLGSVHVANRLDNNWYWGLQFAESKELHQRMKEIVAAYRKMLPPEVPVFANYMAIYFSNATGDDLKRFGDCVVVNRNGTYPMESNCRFYIPTRTNAFGKMVTNTVDMMIDDWKADGIYFDYLEGADPYFTYNQKDGVSCDIDPRTGNLLAEKGSYQLLSQEYLIWLIKHISAKGVKIHANRNPFTWTTTTQLKKETPLRLTECGYPDQLTRGHLSFCPLGLQRTFSNRLHIQLIRALYEGMLTSPYDVRYRWDENPVAYTYPFRFREMRRGCVIGDNRMVTAISGYFGWGDQGNFKCRIFDNNGMLRDENGGKRIVKDGKSYLMLELKPMEVAVIDRLK